MPVPDGDWVCRFIRPTKDCWSEREQRPKPGAFKQDGISVWHIERLRDQYGANPQDLMFGSLAGAGQAHHTIADYHQCAVEAAHTKKEPCDVTAEWRPDDGCVSTPWRKWREAHVQVEVIEGSPKVIGEMRRLLAASPPWIIAPEGMGTG